MADIDQVDRDTGPPTSSSGRSFESLSMPSTPRTEFGAIPSERGEDSICLSPSDASVGSLENVHQDEDRQYKPLAAEESKRFHDLLEAYKSYIANKKEGVKYRNSYPSYPLRVDDQKKQKRSPIVSYGVILFYQDAQTTSMAASAASSAASIDDSLVSEQNRRTILKYFVCHRRDTIEYTNFIRGMYKPEDLLRIFSLMTPLEREKIRLYSFEKLWQDYRPINTEIYHNKHRPYAEERFSLIEPFLRRFITCTKACVQSPEWMFPRGRKANIEQSDLIAAQEEFYEETGIDRSLILPFPVDPVEEMYRGSDKNIFKTVYFVHTCMEKIEPDYIKTSSLRGTTLSNDFSRYSWKTLPELKKLLTKRRYEMMEEVEKKILKVIQTSEMTPSLTLSSSLSTQSLTRTQKCRSLRLSRGLDTSTQSSITEQSKDEIKSEKSENLSSTSAEKSLITQIQDIATQSSIPPPI